MQLTHKEFVCRVTPEVLSRVPRDGTYNLVTDTLWREISYSATSTHIAIRLGNVNEEAARGGYCNGWTNSVSFKLTWADLDDVDCLRRMMQFEPLCVFEKATAMLAHLQEHRKALVTAMTL